MAEGNQTSVTEFVLLGFANVSHLKTVLFLFFFVIYLMTVLLNAGIIVLIHLDNNLHKPMYFFLSHLAFVDLCCSSDVAPKIMVGLLYDNKVISYLGCAAQLYFFIAFACTDNFLLAAMAYDRYVAICNPFMYHIIVTKRLCSQLVVLCYFSSALHSLIQTGTTFQLSFCRYNEINHFFCDIPPLMKISCSDTYVHEIVIAIFVASVTVFSILVILTSYTFILFSILRIRSAEGRHKAFSTCASHFVSVTLFYGTIIFMYMRPSSSYSLEHDRVVSVFYTMMIPVLNPLIYSLRNKEMKNAIRKTISRHILCQKLNSIDLIHS
uniref:Olfactory receptor n=1 Tax=Geotrypetes seraphini TaxID=260995 RepID=A0A6P8NZJ2_GEOSA|nr:olfactory receptor 5AP2-like [Geotrypetes seraphini]